MTRRKKIKKLYAVLVVLGALALPASAVAATDPAATFTYDGTTLVATWQGGQLAALHCSDPGTAYTTVASYAPLSYGLASFASGSEVDCYLQDEQGSPLAEVVVTDGTAGLDSSSDSGYIGSPNANQSSQLDLIWLGVWFLAGVVAFGQLVAPHWNRLFNWWANPT